DTLITAALRADADMVSALLDTGVSPTIRDKKGNTVADYLNPSGPSLPNNEWPFRSQSPEEKYWTHRDRESGKYIYEFNSVAEFRGSAKASAIRTLVGVPPLSAQDLANLKEQGETDLKNARSSAGKGKDGKVVHLFKKFGSGLKH